MIYYIALQKMTNGQKMGTQERKQREKELKRNLFIDCAEDLFFKNGYKETTMDMIAEKSEYSKGTLYLYFKSKEEILAHITLRALNIMSKMFREYSLNASSGMDILYQIGKANFDFLIKYQNYFDMIELYDSIDKSHEQLGEVYIDIQNASMSINEMMISAIIQGKNEGQIKPEMNEFTITYLLISSSKGVFNFINQMRMSDKELPNYNEEDVFNNFFSMVANGIKK